MLFRHDYSHYSDIFHPRNQCFHQHWQVLQALKLSKRKAQ